MRTPVAVGGHLPAFLLAQRALACYGSVMRARPILIISAIIVLLFLLVWQFRSARNTSEPPAALTFPPPATSPAPPPASRSSDSAPTTVRAHNLMLRKGPSFRVYVRWLHGQLIRAHRNVNPSFDDPESFSIDVKTGVLRANIGDLSNFLNASGMAKSPLKNITLSGDGNQVRVRGTLHRIIPLPIEMVGNIGVAPDNRIQIHVAKLSVLKIPFKALLGGFHVSISDLFHPEGIPGIQVSGNDIFLDTQALLPPPHIRGQLTNVRIVNPDIEEIYGNAQKEVERVEQWRNFIRLQGGTLDFGKLTMHQVDLTMIDLSDDPWFDLDLAHYQEQLVNGYTRMTPQAGLQIFMPDLDKIPRNKANQNISIEWFKNRNAPPPADVAK
ncbi:MAG: hypothetical protein JWO80_66 [Bryobacterales bacterium]|nr:hypothetical protein [Bryobacterales bacterium]